MVRNLGFIFFRICMMGSNCDMFEYGPSRCAFFPHMAMKDQNLFKVISRDTSSSPGSIYVLQCSTPYENVLKNNDPFSQSYDGTFSNFKRHAAWERSNR